MLVLARAVSLLILLAAAVVLATLWAKLISTVIDAAGLTLFILAPLPVLGGIFLLGYWLDRRLARMAKRKARERPVDGWSHGQR